MTKSRASTQESQNRTNRKRTTSTRADSDSDEPATCKTPPSKRSRRSEPTEAAAASEADDELSEESEETADTRSVTSLTASEKEDEESDQETNDGEDEDSEVEPEIEEEYDSSSSTSPSPEPETSEQTSNPSHARNKLRLLDSDPLTSIDHQCAASLYDVLWDKAASLKDRIEVPVKTKVIREGSGFDAYGKNGLNTKRKLERRPNVMDLTRLPGMEEEHLKHGILNGRLNKVLITQDYMDLFDMLEDDKQHAVIFGNPGIGKSLFLDFVLVRRILDGKDTVFVSENEVFYSYTKDGFGIGRNAADTYLKKVAPIVRTTPKKSKSKVNNDVWCLFNHTNPDRKHGKSTSAKTILSSEGLDPSGYTEWDAYEQETAPIYKMGLWNYPEFYLLSSLIDYDNGTVNVSKAEFRQRLWQTSFHFDNEPHLLTELNVTGTEEEFEDAFDDHIKDCQMISREFFRTDMKGFWNYSGGREGHKLYASFPAPRPDDRRFANSDDEDDGPSEQCMPGEFYPVSRGEGTANQPRTKFLVQMMGNIAMQSCMGVHTRPMHSRGWYLR
ncbi:hypothetical protein BJ508DRAFT_347621 [Ascobolus immersus RN42]|uniref:Uncharacterized protein n=1 Tax=Ascobolus immersus RN42 TaxID=1160509 RepID=A0A3N4IKP3_ASCIM|nr:hypothetical protein BJ508DRAFT_347621 [Ascobolus immersus RN42]